MKLNDEELEVLQMLKDGWHGGLGGSVYAHFEKGNHVRSFGNGVVFSLVYKGLIDWDDGWGLSVSLTAKGAQL